MPITKPKRERDRLKKTTKGYINLNVRIDPEVSAKISQFCRDEGFLKPKYIGEFLEKNLSKVISPDYDEE